MKWKGAFHMKWFFVSCAVLHWQTLFGYLEKEHIKVTPFFFLVSKFQKLVVLASQVLKSKRVQPPFNNRTEIIRYVACQ
jgi:hypothetical protein